MVHSASWIKSQISRERGSMGTFLGIEKTKTSGLRFKRSKIEMLSSAFCRVRRALLNEPTQPLPMPNGLGRCQMVEATRLDPYNSAKGNRLVSQAVLLQGMQGTFLARGPNFKQPFVGCRDAAGAERDAN